MPADGETDREAAIGCAVWIALIAAIVVVWRSLR